MKRQSSRAGGQARSKPLKPLATARGGGLRVGRVVSDARGATLGCLPLLGSNQLSSVIQEDEQRVHEGLLEMLSAKLAKKEKESELLRRKQEVLDRQHADLEGFLQRQQQETESVREDLSRANQELQRQLQLAQLQCDRLQTESEAQRSTVQEQRRLLEKARAQLQAKTKEQLASAEQLARELQRCQLERGAFERRLTEAQSNGQAQLAKVLELEGTIQELETTVRQLQEDRHHLQDANRGLEQTLALELERRATADVKFRTLEQEKQLADEKYRSLAKTLKETSAKAADTEKKRSSLSRTEDTLTAQLAKLQKENQEMKARLGQQTAQGKHAQARVTSLETANQALEQRLKDADAEVELAHKSCREYLFRVKQLQEEVVFLEKRRKADAVAVEAASEAAVEQVEPSPAQEAAVTKEEDDADIPAWMR